MVISRDTATTHHIEEHKTHTKCPTVRRCGQTCTHLYTRATIFQFGGMKHEWTISMNYSTGGSYQMQMQSIKSNLTVRSIPCSCY